MGHLNLPTSKRGPRQWRLLDLVSAAFFGFVFFFLLLVFTPLGDSLAASGRQALLLSTADPGQHQRLVALVEGGSQSATIEACAADSVDHMPCEDPRRNSQLSREMNFYRERHCPLPDETPLCLIPPPDGYKIPVQWPESLHKVMSSFDTVWWLRPCFLFLTSFLNEWGTYRLDGENGEMLFVSVSIQAVVVLLYRECWLLYFFVLLSQLDETWILKLKGTL